MPDDLRRSFHQQLDEIRDGHHACSPRRVTETIPRATQVLLDGDLEGADYLINGRRRDRRAARSELEERCYDVLALQAPVASDLRQIVTAREDDRRDRAVGRPGRQHLQGGTPHLRHRPRSQAARDHRPDGRAGRSCSSASPIDAYVEARRARSRPRSTTWTTCSTGCRSSSSQQIFESHAAHQLDLAGRRAAGAGRPLLRADRRPRREHRRAGALHGHRLAPEPRPRSGRLSLRRRSTRAR